MTCLGSESKLLTSLCNSGVQHSGHAVSLFLCCQISCFPLYPHVPDLVFALFPPVSLDLNMELPQGQTGSVGTSVASAEQDELSQRLARLRDQV